MAMSVSGAEKWAENENRRNRKITTVKKRISVQDYLWNQVRSNENLLIHGVSSKRECVLYHWLHQLFLDEDVLSRPVIVLGRSNALANEMYVQLSGNELERVRDFIQVDSNHACYEPFLGMSYEQVLHVVQRMARRRLIAIQDWNILHGICEMLEAKGYEISLYNLCQIYGLGNSKVVDLLEQTGFHYAAQEARRNTEEFQRLAGIFQLFQKTFHTISSVDGQSYSILDMVKAETEASGSMPFFYFTVGDMIREDFLDYLAEELRAVSEYAEPIVVVDSLTIQRRTGENSDFYEYLMTAGHLSVTISSQDCASMIPEEEIPAFLGRYGFQMFLLESTDSVEKLTRSVLGEYEHTIIETNFSKYREFFHVLPSGSNSGWSSKKEMRLRIRGVDVRDLKANACYICMPTETYEYTNIVFQR